LFERGLVRERNALVRRDDRFLRQSTPGPAEAGDTQVPAEPRAPALAEVALAAEDVWEHRAPVADGDVRDLGADLHDLGRELVAEDLRQAVAEVDRPLVLVQVRAADPAPLRPDRRLARLELAGRLDLLDTNVVVAVEAGSDHRHRVSPRRTRPRRS